MSENEIISKENYEDEESSHQKIIFDNTLFWTNKMKRIRFKCWKNTWHTYTKKLF